MDYNKRLVASIVKYLQEDAKTKNEEMSEGIEVAIQCLENAYELNDSGEFNDPPLFAVFKKTLLETVPEDQRKIEAEKLKNEGNNLVKADKPEEAIEKYASAVQLDPNNPIYYCNRAAAFLRLKNYNAAIMDCKSALSIDPSYSKAYGRLGAALNAVNLRSESIEAYRKALEYEPDNETYRYNLSLAENTTERGQNISSNSAMPNLEEALSANGNDFLQMIRDPNLINFATQSLQNPHIQGLFASIVNSDPSLLRDAAQRVGERMQANPSFLEAIRSMRPPQDESPEGQ